MAVSTYAIPQDENDLGDSRHPAVGAWFFGPRAENFVHLEKSFSTILKDQKIARQTTYPKDTDFITDAIKSTKLYKDQIESLEGKLGWVADKLSKTSVPFWTPRYNGHMSMESTLPAVVGCM